VEKVPLNVRIDPELRRRLQAVASEQNRTLSNLVETELKRLVGMVATVPTEPPKKRRG
jgi:predicted HicB family RNase H-like nuclease